MRQIEGDALAIGVDESPGRKLRLAKVRQLGRANGANDVESSASGRPVLNQQALFGSEDIASHQPSDWQRYYERACEYSDQGRFHIAIALLSRVARRSGDNVEAFHRLGFAYGELRRYKLAIKCFDKVIQLSPGWSEGYSNRGWSYLRLNDPQSAIEDLLQAVDINPNLASAWANLGQAYQITGRLDKAVACFELATQCDPLNEFYCYQLASCLDHSGDRHGSDRFYCRACEINPHFLKAWIKLVFRSPRATSWPSRQNPATQVSAAPSGGVSSLPNMGRIVKRENLIAADRAARTQERFENLWAFVQNPVSWILVLIFAALLYIALGN